MTSFLLGGISWRGSPWPVHPPSPAPGPLTHNRAESTIPWEDWWKVYSPYTSRWNEWNQMGEVKVFYGRQNRDEKLSWWLHTCILDLTLSSSVWKDKANHFLCKWRHDMTILSKSSHKILSILQPGVRMSCPVPSGLTSALSFHPGTIRINQLLPEFLLNGLAP